jgi:N-acetylneuraminic acid mutarotase
MRGTPRLALLVILFVISFSVCDVKQKAPSIPFSVTLTPTVANVLIGESFQFTATVLNAADHRVIWNLSGAGCSGATCGTISDSGLYTAPASVPSPPFVTIRATAVQDTAKSASATITVVERVGAVEWTWVSGSNLISESGIYGTKGQPSSTNVPGARRQSVSWLDSSGRFWLFGGDGLDSHGAAGELNDLWRFDPTTLEWTWMSGSDLKEYPGIYGTRGESAPANAPGARQYALSWIDPRGNLWLFGGLGYDSTGRYGLLNDLWRYDPLTLEWTWESGSNNRDPSGIYGTKRTADPSNVPGGRQGAVSWLDPLGRFWLFGGLGRDSTGAIGWLNDLWKYDPTTLEWTWVSGSDQVNQKGVYGTQNRPAPANVPGSRVWATSWRQPNSELWIFGGLGYDSAVGGGTLNDLWKFDPTTMEWTWVSGSSSNGEAGRYGTKGTPSPSNVPGVRQHAATWFDSRGNLWLFGGDGYDSIPWVGQLNDLWEFDLTNLQWTWVSGSSTLAQRGPGIYGTKGIADPSNYPGGRYAALCGSDAQGRFWLYGGAGADSSGGGGYLNDLWQGNR